MRGFLWRKELCFLTAFLRERERERERESFHTTRAEKHDQPRDYYYMPCSSKRVFV